MALNKNEIVSEVSCYLSKYLDLIKQINITPCLQLSFNSSDFRDKYGQASTVNQIAKHDFPVIYIISCKNPQERFHLMKRYQAFNLRNKTHGINQGKINIAKFNNTNSETLYIGSTMNNLKSRISQHLGCGSNRTYALHLSKWDNDISYTLDIQSYKIESLSNLHLERAFIELIEQTIWEKYKPVFGKKSGL